MRGHDTICVVEVKAAEWTKMVRNIQPGRSIAHHEYFADGFRAFVCYIEKDAIGYIWFADKMVAPRLSQFDLTLADRDVYLFEYYIDPRFRGHGRSIIFLDRIMSKLTQFGYERAFGWVSAENIEACWTYKILGWTIIRTQRVHVILKCLLVHDRHVFLHGRIAHFLSDQWATSVIDAGVVRIKL
jgi:GNAT superfamily N-acetyltransferase